jgi:hypothetical protein
MTIEQERERLRRIASRLVETTRSGDTEWRRATSPTGVVLDTAFESRVAPEYIVGIRSEDSDGAPPYRFYLRGIKSASEVEHLRTRVARQARTPHERIQMAEDNQLVADLYFVVRDQVLGISKALSAVESQLGL